MFADSRRNPDCIGTVAHADWWNEQIDRCINGYRTGGIHIPGRYYHYLNFVIISGLYGPTYPDFIDLHYEIFLLLEEVKKYKLPGILLPKARRKGLSYFGDAIAMHGMRFISNYRMAVVGGLDNYVQGFRRKLVSTLNNVPPEFMVHTMKLNQDEIAIGVEYKNTSGVWQETKFSDFMFETLQDKANKAEGEFFHDVIFEELGEFEKADSAYESIRPALELGERMEGTFILYGTGGNILKGSRAMKKFYAQHESYGIIPFFVSGARYFYPYYGGAKNRDGTSAEKIPNVKKKHPNLRKEQLLGCEDFYASETKILEVRKQRAINPDKKSLKEWIQKYPLSIEELFTSSGSNNFNNDLLFDCLFKLETNKLLYKPYRLDFVKTDEGEIVQPLQVTVRPVKDDPDDGEIVYIFKMPRLNYKDLDIGGLDGYNEDQTATSDSLGSMVVLRRGDDINVPEDDYYPGLYPVCLYYRRPKRKEIFWETSLKISVLYNLLKNTMIGADADLVIQYYKDQGAKKFLAKRPKAFDSPDGKQMFEFGVKMTAYSKPRLIGVLQSYVESWVHLNVFPLILKDLVAYDDENIGTDWDSADAIGYAVMRVIDMKKAPSGAENNERELNKLPYYYEKNGELHQYIPPQKEKPKQAGETTIIHLDKNVWEAFD